VYGYGGVRLGINPKFKRTVHLSPQGWLCSPETNRDFDVVQSHESSRYEHLHPDECVMKSSG
jgi:hypothetical protein